MNHHIIRTYRNKSIEKNKGKKIAEFEEFIKFLIDKTPISDNIWAKKEHRTDKHWFHYYANCATCDIQYDIIAKMDTVNEDTR